MTLQTDDDALLSRLKYEIVAVEKNRGITVAYIQREGGDPEKLRFGTTAWVSDDPDAFRAEYYRRFGVTPELEWRDWQELRRYCESLLADQRRAGLDDGGTEQ